MKKIIFFAIMMISATILTSAISEASGHERISGKEFVRMSESGAIFTVVDVREPALFKKGHIKGAINIPYDGSHERVAKELSPDDKILFVCHGGPMGDELSDILLSNGFTKVYNLKGGMRAWRGPVVK